MTSNVISSTWSTKDRKCGIVHVGLGAFMRGHLAVYMERYLAKHDENWAICAANIRSNRTIVDQMVDQKCRYHVAEYKDTHDICVREVASITQVLYAGNGNNQELIEQIASPDTKIVTLTITEKGYGVNPISMTLDTKHDGIAHDLNSPNAPISAGGILLKALMLRKQRQLPGLTVLSCDNMPHNGKCCATLMIGLARAIDESLVAWIEKNVTFPSSMVDRIVPATTDDSLAQVASLIGKKDDVAISCEAFSQWVIEDNFCQGRPAFEEVDVTMVDDVSPYEDMKLRMLNGSHSLIAYIGFLSGHQYVADAMKDAELKKFVHAYMLNEAKPTLHIGDAINLNDYALALLLRFENESLKHKTYQIAMDGSQKIPQRWLKGASLLHEQGEFPLAATVGIAAWLLFTRGVDLLSNEHTVQDPMADELKQAYESASDPEKWVEAVLTFKPFSGLSDDVKKAFLPVIVQWLIKIENEGLETVIKSLV